MQYTLRVVAFFLFIFGLLALPFVFLIRDGFKADERQARDEREWREFSAAHHCRLKNPPSFFEPQSVWTCDGFDIRR